MGKEENIVSDQIRKFLEGHGYCVFRMQSGRFRCAGGWVTMNPNGTPDLIAISKTTQCAIFIEVKKPGGKPSEEQLAFIKDVNVRGGIGVCVESLGQLIQRLDFIYESKQV